MENPTIFNSTEVLQDWCVSQSLSSPLPAIVQASFITNSVINSILSFATVIGNIVILMSLRRTSRVHAASKTLYCSLAVTYLVVGFIIQPYFVVRLTGREGQTPTCRPMDIIINAACVISVGVSLQTLSVISVDRVLAIRLKMRYKDVVTVTRIRVVLVICWLYSMSHAVSIFASPAFFKLLQILGIIVCLGVSTAAYVIIFYSLRLLQNQVQNYGSEDETARTGSFDIKRYKKAKITALWVYGSLIACYLPYVFVTAARMSVVVNATILAVQWFAVSLLYMSSALNPILYCWKIQEVRESVKEIIKKCCPCTVEITG